MSEAVSKIDSFSLQPGRCLAGKYRVGPMLGKGWEGEVYHVTETNTGVERAAKFFFPKRNVNNKSINFYARKLDKLRACSIVIHYHTQESFKFRGHKIPFLISEYVHGDLATEFIRRQPGGRVHWFEALHLLHALVKGVEQIHEHGEYHGDLHSDNVIVRRAGVGFDVKVIDMYPWGRRTAEHVLDDVCAVIRIFYDAVGGRRNYANQAPIVKDICCGLRRGLIAKKFKTATRLRRYLETVPIE